MSLALKSAKGFTKETSHKNRFFTKPFCYFCIKQFLKFYTNEKNNKQGTGCKRQVLPV